MEHCRSSCRRPCQAALPWILDFGLAGGTLFPGGCAAYQWAPSGRITEEDRITWLDTGFAAAAYLPARSLGLGLNISMALATALASLVPKHSSNRTEVQP